MQCWYSRGIILKCMEMYKYHLWRTRRSFGRRFSYLQFTGKLSQLYSSFMQFRNVMDHDSVFTFLMTLKEISQIVYVTVTRLSQCYSDILQGKIKFVVIFIVSGMADFQTWKLTHDSKHCDVQTDHRISTNDDFRVRLMHVCTTFTVSRASAGRPHCRWRSGSDAGGGLCQSRLSRAPVEEFKVLMFNVALFFFNS